MVTVLVVMTGDLVTALVVVAGDLVTVLVVVTGVLVNAAGGDRAGGCCACTGLRGVA